MSQRVPKIIFCASYVGAVLAFAFTSTPLEAKNTNNQASSFSKPLLKLTTFIENNMNAHNVVGLSVTVVDDQNIIYSRGFGHQNREKQVPATSHTVYRMGSILKIFTAVAIMQLAEQEKKQFLIAKVNIGCEDTKRMTLHLLLKPEGKKRAQVMGIGRYRGDTLYIQKDRHHGYQIKFQGYILTRDK